MASAECRAVIAVDEVSEGRSSVIIAEALAEPFAINAVVQAPWSHPVAKFFASNGVRSSSALFSTILDCLQLTDARLS